MPRAHARTRRPRPARHRAEALVVNATVKAALDSVKATKKQRAVLERLAIEKHMEAAPERDLVSMFTAELEKRRGHLSGAHDDDDDDEDDKWS